MNLPALLGNVFNIGYPFADVFQRQRRKIRSRWNDIEHFYTFFTDKLTLPVGAVMPIIPYFAKAKRHFCI